MIQSCSREYILALMFQTLKILLPHVALIAVLLSYTAFGAAMLMFLETRKELSVREAKLERIKHLYGLVVNESWSLAGERLNRSTWDYEMRRMLLNLSREHAGEMFTLNPSDLTTHWTFPASVLYALTVLTTCGEL